MQSTPVSSDPRSSRFLTGAAAFLLYVSAFLFVPRVLDFGESARVLWIGLFQVAALAVATALSAFAALRGPDNARSAWVFFAVANLLYLLGNLYYFYCMTIDYVPSFPNVPEMAFFGMAVCASLGMASYGEVRSDRRRTNVYNFVMVYCAISIACLLVLHDDFESSSLSRLGSVMAFLYPALWLSVAAFGLITLLIYKHGPRSLPFKLLVAYVAVEAFADVFYAKRLLDGSYVQGGLTELLWVASIGLSIWAAVAHLSIDESYVKGRIFRRLVQNRAAIASLPGAAIAILAGSAVASGAVGDDVFYVGCAIVIGIVFAGAAGLREHSIIRTLESLRDEATEGKRRLDAVLETTSDSIIVVDRDWTITYFNGAASRNLATDIGLRIGEPFWSLTRNGQAFPGRRAMLQVRDSGKEAEFEASFGSEDLWLGVRVFPSSDGLSIFFRNISERRRVRLEIENLALRDTLTGLSNRAAFQRALGNSIANDRDVAILLIDLDHFKNVNDTLGHPVGDEVLRSITSRLRDCAGNVMTARLGGDEFAIILDDVSEPAASALAEQINASVSRPVHVGDDVLHVGCSIGIAVGNPSKIAPDILFRNADIALYEVKNSGRGGFAFFREAMEAILLERNGMKQDLATALENDEFELHYQPLVDLATGRISSCEALLRWNHPERGLMPPDTFIPLIEESGLIIPIGAWVMRTACRDAATWPGDVSVAVNISTRQFSDRALVDTIGQALEDSGLPTRRLELEITESALLNDSGDNVDLLNGIRNLGLKIALDDFGTGYSSLGYLQKFKFDKLKIDKSFVQGLNVREESEVIVRSVIGLGKTLGMDITAEGVETADQFDWVSESCQHAQGHFISRPIDAQSTLRFLQAGHVFTPSDSPASDPTAAPSFSVLEKAGCSAH